MKTSLMLIIVLAAGLITDLQPANAKGWRHRVAEYRQRHRAAQNDTLEHRVSAPIPADRFDRDPSWYQPELYPQWYGGFHGRFLQNYGHSPSEIGLRGMAW